ncbi:membrane protein [Streptomyces griseoflavus]|uniref:DUF3533 domain-containing protein n=1 Tax=Streptomyces griseoflavus TaxID=35619 RepID=UPI00167EA461|nr:DUF3533 domain-containing protein [Streptomyces griseoflavus]GGV35172.1 membrane protein [Streptomyces griseoflavus]
MTPTPGTGPAREPLGSAVRRAVTPWTVLVVAGVIALQLLFIASYVGALHRPELRDVPFGVVAPPAAAAQETARLERLPGSPLDPRTVADEATARERILDRSIDGALITGPDGGDTLLVASGGGAVLATDLQRLLTGLERPEGRTLRTVDVAPASPQDFDGLSSFYASVGWCVGGYLCAAMIAIVAGARPAGLLGAVVRIACMALVALVGGLGGAVIVGPVLGALPGSVGALWGLGALITFAVGAATLALQGFFDIIGIGLAILLVVVAGNPSAGGALPPPMLPPFWEAIGPALPPGAGTWTARSIAYFEGNAVLGPLLVLSAWAVVGSVLTLLSAVVRRGERQGEPLAGVF